MAITRVTRFGTGFGPESGVFSPDGSKDAFFRFSSNVVAGDSDGRAEIFENNLSSGGVTPISTGTAGVQGNGASDEFSLSADGTKLVFTSESTNFVGDSNMFADVFLKDLVSGAISRISTGSGGNEANRASEYGTFSPDGTRIAFSSLASNLVGGDTNGIEDIFVKEIASGAITRISTSNLGDEANGLSSRPVFSPDGNLVAFTSTAPNLVSGDTNNAIDLFVKNLTTGAITRVSTDAFGNQGNLGAQMAKVVFSPDGTKLAFSSFSSNFAAGDTNDHQDIFVKNLATGAITRVSVGTNGEQGNFDSVNPVFSPDGSKIMFDTSSNGLVAGDTNNAHDIFIKDLATGQLTRVSTGAGGVQSNGFSGYGAFSADGTKIAFASEASNLVSGDTNGVSDIFVKDLATGVVAKVSGGTGAAQADGESVDPVFLPNGSVAFTSYASNLVVGDTNGVADIFIATLEAQTPVTDYAKVNTTVQGAQFAPAVAALSGGGYVIVWEDSSAGRIFAQRFSATGQPVGNELQLDSTQGGAPLWVSVAATANDGFVIAFQAGSFAQAEIFGHRYDSANNPVGGLFAVNTTGPNEQFNPHIVTLDGGGLLFTWDTRFTSGNDDVFQEVRGRIFLPDGQALGNDFPIAPMSATLEHGISAIAPLPGGGFVVTWQSGALNGNAFDIVGQRFTSSGATAGGQFQVNADSANSLYGNDVARLSDGGFVVSWVDAPGSDGGGRIVARHYGADGDPVGGEILVDSKASGSYGRTVVTALADGAYVVSWTEADAADNNVLARQFGANDVAVGAAFEMSFNSPFGANYFSDGAVTLANGNVVFAWDGPSITPPGGQGTGQDIYMRMYSFTAAPGPVNGTPGPDALVGTPGNDSLNGKGGDDTLTGGTGNDLYIVDSQGDVIVELTGEGDDTVGASASYALAAGVSVEVLATTSQSGTAPIALTGNELAQSIFGNEGDNILTGGGGIDQLVGYGGNDTLIGGAGIDYLRGGLGNDLYAVDEGDVIFEAAGEGDDSLAANVGSYYLNEGASIETLSTANQAGTFAQNLTGNEFGQTVAGSEGANVLNGRGGNDLLRGYGGADIFLFDTTPGAANHDVIADMAVGVDRIALQNSIFTGLAEGNLGAEAFVVGSQAQDANDRIIWNPATNQLFYDADGNGAGAALLFAIVNGAPNLQASDFIIV